MGFHYVQFLGLCLGFKGSILQSCRWEVTGRGWLKIRCFMERGWPGETLLGGSAGGIGLLRGSGGLDNRLIMGIIGVIIGVINLLTKSP